MVLAGLLLAAASQAQVQVVSSLITTFAGGGTGCAGQTDPLGDGCPAADSGLRNPTGVAVDSFGNLYIVDDFDNVIRKVSAATGEITTVAGSGTGCAGQTDSIGDGCPATSAPLSNPQAVAVDSQGNFYVIDYGNTRIRKVTAATGTITTVAGNGTPGYIGDNNQATSAELDNPLGLAVNPSGTLLYIADTGNNVVRQVNLTTGVITTFAGNGFGAGTTGGGYTGDNNAATGAEMWHPSGVALDSNGNLYIADTYNSAIREVNASTLKISTVAGNGSPNYTGDGGLATSATLYFPNDVTVDSAGDLYIADSYNCLIREVNAVTRIITTVAGNPQDAGQGQGTFGGDNGPPTLANLNIPDGVAIDSHGNLYIADTLNYRVRKVSAPNSILNFPATSVGASAPSQNILLYFGAYYTEQPGLPPTEVPITISSIGIPQSAGGIQEFNLGTLSGCVADGATPINAGSICTVPITFKPGYPGLREAPLELQTNAGPFYFGLSGIGIAPQPALIPGLITAVAGNGYAGPGQGGAGGYTGDNGPATSAELSAPFSVAFDNANDFFIADYDNFVIRKVSGTTGIITTVAGNGTGGYTGDNYPATGAEMTVPWDASLDAAGNIYIADTNNNAIREVSAATGIITTVAGACCAPNGPGLQGYNGDGIPAVGAELFFPESVAADTSGNLYIADYGNNRIREVNAATGIITTVAGNGFGGGTLGAGGYNGDNIPATSAELFAPAAVALDSAGNIYIADFSNLRIRKVTAATGIITTVAGDGTVGPSGDNGPATSAALNPPIGIAVDAAGDLYITGQNAGIRKVDAATGTITTLVPGNGTGCAGQTDTAGDGCAAASASLNSPENLGLDSAGNLYVADAFNERIRKISIATPPLDFPQTALGASSAALTFKVANIGNAPLNFSAITPTANFGVDSGTTTCSTTNAVTAGGSCVIGVVFSPTSGGATTGTLILTDNALNVAGSTQQVALNGTIGASSGTPDFTITTFTPTMEVPLGGDSATYVLTITAEDGFGGTVALGVSGDSNLGVTMPASVTIPPGGSQNFNVTITSQLSPSGTFPFTITGSTSGGLQHSVVISLIVDKPALTPTVTVTPASPIITTAQALMVTVTVSGGSGNPTPTGYITLTSGTYTSSAATLSGGSATINIPAGSLATALDTLTATYSPDSAGGLNYANAMGSNTVTVTAPSLSFVSNVGTALPSQPATVSITTAGTLNSIQVLTQGQPGLDFTETSGGTCATTTAYTVGQTCTVNVIFKPQYSGARWGAVVLTNSSGVVLGTTYLPGTGVGPQIAFMAGDFLGLNLVGFNPGILHGEAADGVAADPSGDIYIANLVDVTEIPAGCTTTSCYVTMSGGNLTQPEGVAIDGSGNLYVSNAGSPGSVVELPLGCTSSSCAIVLGGGWANPREVAVDGTGNVYVADTGNNAVKEMPPGCLSSSCVTTLGGGFNATQAVAVDGKGNVFVVDENLSTLVGSIKEMPAGCSSSSCVTTLLTNLPPVQGVAVDAAGDVYFFQAVPSDNGVYEMEAVGGSIPASPTVIPLITDTSSVHPTGNVNGIALDGAGDVYFGFSSVLLELDVVDLPTSAQSELGFEFMTATPVGSTDTTDDPMTLLTQNIGNMPLAFTGITPTTNFLLDADTTCSTSTALAEGATCLVGVDFAPLSVGGLAGTLTLTDNNLNVSGATQPTALSGGGIPATVTGASLAPNPVTFTGQVAGTTSEAMAITLSNNSTTTALTGITASITGTNPSDFAISTGTNACGTTLAADSSCSIYVTFTPASAAGFTATLSVSDSASGSPQTVTLNGAGVGFSSNVGTAEAAQTVTVNIARAGTPNSIQVLTQGQPGLDFTETSGGTCKTTTAYTVGQTCTVNVIFKPQVPGARPGAVLLADASNNILGIAYLPGIGTGPEVTFSPGVQSTLPNYTGQNAALPYGVAVDAGLNVYVTDYINSLVVKMPWTGSAYGTPVQLPFTGLYFPEGVAVDGAGDVFAADEGNSRVVELPWNGSSYGTQIVLANYGYGDYPIPTSVAVDSHGNLFFAEVGHGTIPTALIEMPWTGSGYDSPTTITAATGLNNPLGLAVDANLNIYIADSGNNRVVEIPWNGTSFGTEIVVASGIFGAGVAVDGGGDVYITNGSSSPVVEVPWNGTAFGTPVTVPFALVSGADLYGIAVDGYGNLYVSSDGYERVVELNVSTPPSLSFASTNVGSVSTDSPQTVAVSNIGNAPLTFSLSSDPAYPTDFPENTSGTSLCAPASPLTQGGSCNVSINFKPTTTGPFSEDVVLTDNNLNASNVTQSVAVSGTGTTGTLTPQTINFTQPTTPVTWASGLTIPLVATGGASGNPVVFTIDGSSTGTGSISGSTLNVTNAGTFVIDANQAGNASYTAAPQVQRTVTVNQAVQTITFTQPTSPVIYSGTSVNVPLSATGGASGNPVVFTIDGSSTGTGSISGGTLTVTSVGNFVIDANQAGNTNYFAAAQVQRTVIANSPNAQTINFTQPATPVTYSSGLTIPLVATGGASGNPVVFTIDGSSTGTGSITGSTLNVTNAGTFVIDANQAGNATYTAAPQVQRTVAVNQAAQTITFTQPTSPVIYSGTSVNVPLSATGGASGNAVVFTIDGSSTGTGSISGSTLTVTSVGNFVIDANQAGNTNYSAAAQVQRTVIANSPNAQTINFTQPTTPVIYSSGLTIPLVATGGASGNPVVFTIDGSSTGTGSISGSTLTVTSAGSFVIDANQAGNATYTAAPQVQRTAVVNQAPQAINFTQPSSPVTYSSGLTVPLAATGGASGNAVVFTIDGSSTGTGTISGSTLTVTSTGNLVIDANQAGNADYSAAPQVQKTIVVNAPVPDFKITATTTSQGVQPGGTTTFPITVADVGASFTGTVTLSVSGLPTGATGSFSPPTITPGSGGGSSTLTVTLPATANLARPNFWPVATPVMALLFMLPFRRWRKVWRAKLLLLVAGLASLGCAASFTGCGGGFGFIQYQTYTLTITGTSGVDTHSTTVQLTVQQ
jgi:sugar lactone lactonase YvrE